MTVMLGYTILYVDDVRSTIDFYQAAFRLAERFVTPEGDYGELDTGETTLAFASNSLGEANLSPRARSRRGLASTSTRSTSHGARQSPT
jgi:catechol 2,3-dioxygenase-like lactoylglutathione lyase family enzyme